MPATSRILLALSLTLPLSACSGQISTSDRIEQLKDPDVSLRLQAVHALGKSSTDPQQAVPALIAALKDSDAFVRRDAAKALGKYGTAAKPAAPVLLAALGDPQHSVREAAADALRVIDPSQAPRGKTR
jgi:HEAT repeat protein